ncbi:hypothetical protein AKO1_000253 [Acrasis kona]|uniref:Uncharacterized protein n=1 Tax=Acrasis kona TaxID=1008807 RepID=A0AAW2ZCG6_9EUKA
MSMSSNTYTESMIGLLEYMNQISDKTDSAATTSSSTQAQAQKARPKKYKTQAQKNVTPQEHQPQTQNNMRHEQMNDILSNFISTDKSVYQNVQQDQQVQKQQPIIIQTNGMDMSQFSEEQIKVIQNALMMQGVNSSSPLIILNVGQAAQQQQQQQHSPFTPTQDTQRQQTIESLSKLNLESDNKRRRDDEFGITPIDTKRTKISENLMLRRGSVPIDMISMQTPDFLSPGFGHDSSFYAQTSDLFSPIKTSAMYSKNEDEDFIKQFMSDAPNTPHFMTTPMLDQYSFGAPGADSLITVTPSSIVDEGTSKHHNRSGDGMLDVPNISSKRRASTGSIGYGNNSLIASPNSDAEGLSVKTNNLPTERKKRRSQRKEPEDVYMSKFSLRS